MYLRLCSRSSLHINSHYHPEKVSSCRTSKREIFKMANVEASVQRNDNDVLSSNVACFSTLTRFRHVDKVYDITVFARIRTSVCIFLPQEERLKSRRF